MMTAHAEMTTHTFPPIRELIRAGQRIVARDATADGQFWYSVATTGVYLPAPIVPVNRTGQSGQCRDPRHAGRRPPHRLSPLPPLPSGG